MEPQGFIPPTVDYAVLPGRTPRCIGCGYTLTGLPEPRCPECGRWFDMANPATFTVKPPLQRWRYWMPGFLLALCGGMALFAFSISASGFLWATTLVVPTCIGALLGYGVRVRYFVLTLLSLVLLGGLLLGITSMNLAGMFCGLILASIALGPILFGTLCGFILRQILKHSSFDQRWHLPTIFFLLIPLAAALVDRATWVTPPAEAVQTTADIDLPIEAAWRNVRFYEQVPGEPPAIFRWRWLGLPRPLRVTGTAAAAGDRTVCVYDKGRLVKEATEVSAAVPDGSRRLGFRVVEQGFEQHAMRLVGGSFALAPIDARRTRVTLETTYVPHMGPRWCWRPFERWTVHKLHGHVLHAMGQADASANADADADARARSSGWTVHPVPPDLRANAALTRADARVAAPRDSSNEGQR